MMNGTVDQVDGLTVRGWATHPDRQAVPAELDFYVDGDLVGRAVADIHRPDLQSAGIGHGNHGFSYRLPESCADGRPHRLWVRWRGSNLRLPGVDQFLCEAMPAFSREADSESPQLVASRPLPEALAELARHRRIAIVASFSPHERLWSYQLELLRGLKDAGFAVVLVHSYLGHAESILAQAATVATLALARPNRGFDFASFQCAIALLEPLFADLDELVLANDSVFGPVRPLDDAFRRMAESPADFWGVTDSWDVAYHVQSYFLVFRATALRHPAFARFWGDYPASTVKREVIVDGEVGLTQKLMRAGLRCDVLCRYEDVAREWLARPDHVRAARNGKRGPDGWIDWIRGWFAGSDAAALHDDSGEPRAPLGYTPAGSFHDMAVAALAAGVPVNPTHTFWETLLERFHCPFVKRDLVLKNPTGVPGLDRLAGALARVGSYRPELIEEVRRLATRPMAPPVSLPAPDQAQREAASRA